MQPSRAHLSPNPHAFSMAWLRSDRAVWWTCVPSRACPVRTASTSAAVSPWTIARARAPSRAGVERGMADCSSHVSTAVFVVSHFRPTFRPGRSPRCRRSYTVSAETVSNCAVIGTSRTSGQRPAAGAAGRVGGRDGVGRASSRLGPREQSQEEHNSKDRPLLQQKVIFYVINPNIPEVFSSSSAHARPCRDTPPYA